MATLRGRWLAAEQASDTLRQRLSQVVLSQIPALKKELAARGAANVALTKRVHALSSSLKEATRLGEELVAASPRHVAVSLKWLLDESPWLQLTSECQRFGPPPRLNK